MAVRVLLDIDVVHFAEVTAHAGDLVLDVHEEGRVFLEVHLSRIKHSDEENAVAWASARLRLTTVTHPRIACLSLASTGRSPRQH